MKHDFLDKLGLKDINNGCCFGINKWNDSGDRTILTSYSPIDGERIADVRMANADDYESTVKAAQKAFLDWRTIPAPKRGLVIMDLGAEMRKYKEPLGKLVTLEMGKICQEGIGEVQEVIDVCDFAVGLSRQLYGLTMQSEREQHRMYEQWHPLGTMGIITAFNFPVAVWGWNAAIAGICGDTMIWKPSSKTPLTAIATQKIANRVMEKHGVEGIMNLVIGRGSDIGELLINDKRIPLVSATGSCAMGKRIGNVVSARLGRTILELGGNNAIIVDKTADLDMTVRAILFGAVGTAGQRCTTTRRIIVDKEISENLITRLSQAYVTIPIGNPLDESNLMGPLIDDEAVDIMMRALEQIKSEGGEIVCGGEKIKGLGCYVKPCIVKAKPDLKIIQEETFAPILYILEFEDVEQAIDIHNNVPQGLSSAMFTTNVLNAERFLSAAGSDCGIANINIGTSGAEIGGAFGGEKETGGGRESGSDAWKQYMRRQTVTINWSTEMPLAQGIKFGD